MENNYCQLKDMTEQEKFEMYMNVPHEKLVRMKIEEERVLEEVETQLELYKSKYYCVNRILKNETPD